MLLLALMWGLSIPLTKLGLQSLPPLTLTALRFAVAIPLLMALALRRRRLPLRAGLRVAALGVLGVGVGQLAQTFGVAGTSASVGTIISAMIPLLVVLFAALRLKQPVSLRQQLGLLAAFCGIALVGFGDGDDAVAAQATTLAGVAWMLLSSVAIAFYYVWSVELTREFGTSAVAAWSTVAGFLVLAPLAAAEFAAAPVAFTAQGLAVVLYLGLIVTVAGLFLWLRILRNAPASVAASVQYLQPIFGVALAAAMFGDRLGLLFALGVGLVLGGLWLTVAAPRD
ncbi:MAG: DMT family transporter [Methylobacteriaceae bacterium]|nr:DMT family transporter [Methylobacteriaceae bacterium]